MGSFEEGLFFADDLAVADRAVLEAYVNTHPADTDRRKGIAESAVFSDDSL